MRSDHVHRTYSGNVQTSIVIPSADGSRGGNLALLLDDLERQSYRDMELFVIVGVSPQGKAINQGVARTKGRFLVILDDDSRMPDPDTISTLVAVLDANPDVGMAGASIVQPPDAGLLQRLAAREFPRFSMKVVDRLTDSDMPCHGCCALRRQVFEEIGGERESIVRGLDPDLRQRLRSRGYRVVLAPGTSVCHAMPATVSRLIRMFFRNGRGSAYAQRHHPDVVFDTEETTGLSRRCLRVPLAVRIARYPLRTVRRLLKGQIIRMLGDVVYLFGYVWGTLRDRSAGRHVDE
jgi:GT2 family glycosyltransferase